MDNTIDNVIENCGIIGNEYCTHCGHYGKECDGKVENMRICYNCKWVILDDDMYPKECSKRYQVCSIYDDYIDCPEFDTE